MADIGQLHEEINRLKATIQEQSSQIDSMKNCDNCAHINIQYNPGFLIGEGIGPCNECDGIVPSHWSPQK